MRGVLQYYHNPNDQSIFSRSVDIQAGSYVGDQVYAHRSQHGIFSLDDRVPDRIGPVPGTGTYEGSLLFYHEEIGGERIGFCVGFISTLPQSWGSNGPSRCGIFSRCTTHNLEDYSKGSLNILNNHDRIDVLNEVRFPIYGSVADYARWSYLTSIFGIFFDDDYPVIISSVYICFTQ